jgi:hypothetical protein
MLRSAVAVLAIALSSVAAAAQGSAEQKPVVMVSYSIDVEGQMPEMPASLTNMYFKHAALQGLDALTTISALNRGHAEANPLLSSGNTALIVGGKIAATSLSVYLTQKLWKRNRKAAIVTMFVTNAILSAAVINNSAVLRR